MRLQSLHGEIGQVVVESDVFVLAHHSHMSPRSDDIFHQLHPLILSLSFPEVPFVAILADTFEASSKRFSSFFQLEFIVLFSGQ
jgi:hypothetical protein